MDMHTLLHVVPTSFADDFDDAQAARRIFRTWLLMAVLNFIGLAFQFFIHAPWYLAIVNAFCFGYSAVQAWHYGRDLR